MERMNKLLAETPLTWRAIHVATVDDATSVCNMISASFDYYNRSRVLELTKLPVLSWGKFTQHTIDRWDGISINDQTISKSTFEQLETRIKATGEQIGATRSEIMTAIAFQAFTDANVDVGIVEAMSAPGDEEPTSVIATSSGGLVRAPPICTVPIDLGSHKLEDRLRILIKQAPLYMADVPIISAAEGRDTNCPEAVAIWEMQAKIIGTTIITYDSLLKQLKIPDIEDALGYWYNIYAWPQPYGARDSSFMAALYTLMHLGRLDRPVDVKAEKFEHYLAVLLANFESVWEWADDPGATQVVLIKGPTENGIAICLVPNTHSPLDWSLEDVHQHARPTGIAVKGGHTPLIWLFAADEDLRLPRALNGKVRPGDAVIATAFSEVDGQPDIKATAPQVLLDAIRREIGHKKNITIAVDTVREALNEAIRLAEKRKNSIVVFGSRWLVSNVLLLIRDGVIKPSTPHRGGIMMDHLSMDKREFFDDYYDRTTSQFDP